MAAQVEVQTGEVGRPGAGGRHHLSPLTDSSNTNMMEIPSINQSHIITREPKKPTVGPKPRLSPKPFALERNSTVRPIVAPKPQTKPRPESTRLAGYKPELACNQKPQQPSAVAKSRPTNPNRPSSTSFKTTNNLSSGQTTKLVVQPFKPAPPFDPGDPTKPSRPVAAHRRKQGISNLGYSKSLKKPPSAEWSGTTKKDIEKDTVESNRVGPPITRAKSMGFLDQVGQEEEEHEKNKPDVAVPLRPQPRRSKPRPVSAIFLESSTKTEAPTPAPRWAGRRPLSADLTSKFESIGLSLHRSSANANTKENCPEKTSLTPQTTEPESTIKTSKRSTPPSTDAVDGPLSDQSTQRQDETTVKETDEPRHRASIKSRISLLLDSPSVPETGSASQGSVPDNEPPVGVKQLIKQLTEDSPMSSSPNTKPAVKPRPLSLDLTKRFSSERSPDLGSALPWETTDPQLINKDPQKKNKELTPTPSDLRTVVDIKDSPRLASTPEETQVGPTFDVTSGRDVQTVRAALFENVVERHTVHVVDERKPVQNPKDPHPNPAFNSRSTKEEGTIVTATYKEPVSLSSPVGVLHTFDAAPPREEKRPESERGSLAHWSDQVPKTLSSRPSETPKPDVGNTGLTQTEPSLSASPEQQPRYLRVGALPKWTTTDSRGTPKESDRDGQVFWNMDTQEEVEQESAPTAARLKLPRAEDQQRPRATYFALTGQVQEPLFPIDTADMFVSSDEFSVRSALMGPQGKIHRNRRNPSLEEAISKSPQAQVEEQRLKNQGKVQPLNPGVPPLEDTTESVYRKEMRKEVDKHKANMKELEREKHRQLEMEFVSIKEREMQRESERQRQKAFKNEVEMQKQIDLERQRLQDYKRQKMIDSEKLRLQEQERQKKQKESEREAERERQRLKEEERQRALERQRMEELERQQLLEFQKQKERQQLEAKKRRLKEKKEREEARMKQMALKQEMLRLKELEKERERQKEMERQEAERQKEMKSQKEIQHQKEVERQKEVQRQKEVERQKEVQRQKEVERQMERQKEFQRQMELERQMEMERQKEVQCQMEAEQREMERMQQLHNQRQELENQRLKQQELDKERQREEEERRRILELEKRRQREKQEREEAEKIRTVAKQQEAERQQLGERLKREEQEASQSEPSVLRHKGLDLDHEPWTTFQHGGPAPRWNEPVSYKPAILDVDTFMTQPLVPPNIDLYPGSGVQGVDTGSGPKFWKVPTQTSAGFSSPVWTQPPNDPWELSVDRGAAEPRKHSNTLTPEQVLLRPEKHPVAPQRPWSGLLDESLHPTPNSSTDPKPGNTTGQLLWLPRELQPQDGREVKGHRRSVGSQGLNRMRSRSVSRRSAPSGSTVEGSLSRMRSRSAHREQDRHSWQKQSVGAEDEANQSETSGRESDSQYGTWETGLRTDDSLTLATPSSESNLSLSPRKATPSSQSGADTLDGLLPPAAATSSSDNQTLSFPDAPTTLLDTSALRSRAQLGKRRAPRSRLTRAVRSSAQGGGGEGATSEDWLYQDSTETKSETKASDSDCEEQVRRAAPSSQPKRTPLFPGMDPSALKAQLKKRAEADVQTDGAPPTSSQLSHSPKSPFLPRAKRVLPPAGVKETG